MGRRCHALAKHQGWCARLGHPALSLGEGHGSRSRLGRVPGCREVWGASSPTPDLTGRTRGERDSLVDLCPGRCGAGSGAGEGGVRKAIPAALGIAGPTLGAPVTAGGGARPLPGPPVPICPFWRTRFGSRVLLTTCPRAGTEGTRWQGHTQPPAATPTLPAPPFPRCKPRALGPCGCAPGCCHLRKGSPAADNPPIESQGSGQPGVTQARVPLGGGKGSAPGPRGRLAQRRAPARGAPVSLYAAALPAPAAGPRPPAGRVPGEDASSPLAGSGARGWRSAAAPRRAAPPAAPRGGCAVFLAAGRRAEGVKPVTLGPFHRSAAGHLRVSTIRLGMDLETM